MIQLFLRYIKTFANSITFSPVELPRPKFNGPGQGRRNVGNDMRKVMNMLRKEIENSKQK
ncbi:MAG: hypothetical protein FWC61_04660 [Proteobacteria bacterium]|nr:hypothetical protein [Pseudomonadota bacterium]